MKPDCIEWKGAVAANGYGVFKVGGRGGVVVYAHRISYRLHVGEIPRGRFVCHSCDNPICINPDHFFIGTCSENNADMRAKGRGKNPTATPGESNPAAKLTQEQVDSIKAALATGVKGKWLAEKFGVTPQAISHIKMGKSW